MQEVRPPPLNIQSARLKQIQNVETPSNLGTGGGGGNDADKNGVNSGNCGYLSPNLQPATPPSFQTNRHFSVSLLGGRYILLNQLEGSSLYRCVHVQTQEEIHCKIVPSDAAGNALLPAHYRVDSHPHVNSLQEVIFGDRYIYLIFPRCYGDLHSHVRAKRRLREAEARALFEQIVKAVHHCHEQGIVLRDLKLRKFVFADEQRTQIKLETFEDAVVLEDQSDDLLHDKHGCPAYVSPEILNSNAMYSGRAADMWGLGVMLYTMLVGRYPFHDSEHAGLFAKIRKGQFVIPDSVSSRAKCLVKCLLRREPDERLTTCDVLKHPWFTSPLRGGRGESARGRGDHRGYDQIVPDFEQLIKKV